MADQNNPRIDEQITELNGYIQSIDSSIVTIGGDLDDINAALPAQEE